MGYVLKIHESEITVYILFGASKVKFIVETPHIFGSLGLH